jgi:ethanolamine utilization protein EutQ
MDLAPFPVELHRPEMDVRLRDVVTSAHGMPMAAGMMSLRQGSFPWTLDYDEVEYVIEGELHITTPDQKVVGRPGDVIAVPKGSSITFGTPSWARFFYVTYPADWAGAS